MQPSCQELRASLLPGEPAPPAMRTHIAVCAECAAWVGRAGAVASALAGLARQEVPRGLEGAVAVELELVRGERRHGDLLRGLERLPAPGLLRDLLDGGVPAWERGIASSLGVLGRRPAPHVLERLVDEELRNPTAHRARRFAGDLERVTAPPDLDERVRRVGERRPIRLRLFAPFAGLAAACLVLWIGALRAGVGEHGEAPGYRFRVVRVDSIDQLDPLARLYADGLTGGALSGTARGEGR